MQDQDNQLLQMRRMMQITLVLTGINTLAMILFVIGIVQIQAKLTDINARIQQVEATISAVIETTRENAGIVLERLRNRLRPTPDETPFEPTDSP